MRLSFRSSLVFFNFRVACTILSRFIRFYGIYFHICFFHFFIFFIFPDLHKLPLTPPSTEWQEDIKLPSKVEVELKPADNESWYTVQSLAQNPRVKTSLPLQRRLISLLKTLQLKWRSRESKMVNFYHF